MVSKALILFLVGAQAGIYPDNHWDFSTELTADSADAFVKDNVDAGKTASWRHKGHGNQGGTNRYLCGDVWNHSSHHACLYLLKSIQCSHVYVHEYLAYLVVIIQQKQFKCVKPQLSPVVSSKLFYGVFLKL